MFKLDMEVLGRVSDGEVEGVFLSLMNGASEMAKELQYF